MFHKRRSRRKQSQLPVQEIFDQTLRDALRQDPELARALAFINAGYADMVGKTTPQYRRMMKLEEVIGDKAIAKLEKSPDLQDRLSRFMMDENVPPGPVRTGQIGKAESGATPWQPVVVGVIETVKQIVLTAYDPTKEQDLDKLVRQALNQAVKLVTAIKPKTPPAPAEPMVILADRGKLVSVKTSEFRRLIRQGRVQPVGRVVPPEVVTRGTAETGADKEPELVPDAASNISLSWEDYSVKPIHFVEQLRREMLAGESEAQQLWNFLLNASHKQVVMLFRSCRIPRRDKSCVKKITSSEGRAWTGEVIRLVQQAGGKDVRE